MAEEQKSNAAIDPDSNTFTLDVALLAYDPSGKVLKDADGADVVERHVGRFVFRTPTIWDLQEIGVRKATLLKGMSGLVDEATDTLADIRATLPHLCREAPEGWDWSKLMPKDIGAVVAVYREYAAALGRF